MILDFLAEFRFEYMWPCWLLIHTINDSFKYQGMAFAIFFTLIALTSDLVCYLLVPSSWLFLFGSTCVWIELVWHTERCVCIPTVTMCLIFLYVEVMVRLRDPKTIPLGIDLCRPFAAHCIGYPVVTLGFGLKSLISHQLRSRRQQQIKTQNSKYFSLLELALPEEARSLYRRGEICNGKLPALGPLHAIASSLPTTTAALATNTPAVVTSTSSNSTSTVAALGSAKSSRKQQHQNQTNGKSSLVSSICDHPPETRTTQSNTMSGRKFFSDDDDHNQNHQLRESGENSPGSEILAIISSSSSISSQDVVEARSTNNFKKGSTAASTAVTITTTTTPIQCNTVSVSSTGKSKTTDKASRTGKDGSSAYRLEEELRKLRLERQNMFVTESELRTQITQLTTLERTSRTETSQARQEVEHLQSKLATLVQKLQTERENVQLAEKKAAEEKRQRTSLETSLAAERRAHEEAKSALSASTPALVAITPTATGTSSAISSKAVTKPASSMAVGRNRTGSSAGRCTSESCFMQIHDMETQLRALTHELALKETQLVTSTAAFQVNQTVTSTSTPSIFASERQKLMPKQQQHKQTNELNCRINDLLYYLGELEAENSRLKATLKAEDKVKQELLAGYHNSLKEITELNSTLTRKEYQIAELNMRLDLSNPNGPYGYMLGASTGISADASAVGDGREMHQRSVSSYMNGSGGGNDSIFTPRSTDTDFDFYGGGGGGGWPTFTTSSASSLIPFSDQQQHHHHQQQQYLHQNKLRPESNSAVLSALSNARELQATSPRNKQFDDNVVDLEAASNCMSPPEFLSKLRSQLAMTGSGGIGTTHQQQPAPIGSPSCDVLSSSGGGERVAVVISSESVFNPGGTVEAEGNLVDKEVG